MKAETIKELLQTIYLMTNGLLVRGHCPKLFLIYREPRIVFTKGIPMDLLKTPTDVLYHQMDEHLV